MTYDRIMPENLVIGDRFRLTGSAENLQEAADTNVYEVLDLDMKWIEMNSRKILINCWALVRVGEGEPTTMGIGPWVPLLRVT